MKGKQVEGRVMFGDCFDALGVGSALVLHRLDYRKVSRVGKEGVKSEEYELGSSGKIRLTYDRSLDLTEVRFSSIPEELAGDIRKMAAQSRLKRNLKKYEVATY
ncbi:hypothetical protein HY448_01155 [Candidatus Pacearchaeota archaeon]|nr:hypothetical protein [Candidatus Pacearchaeota archaeon]